MKELKLPDTRQQILNHLLNSQVNSPIKSIPIGEVKQLLESNFKKNSKSHHDYVKAKRLIFSGEWNRDYDKIIKIIVEYLGI